MAKVLVLGGGIIGVASAYYLARRGFQVTVLERQPAVGLETSFANGGLLTPSMADPWAAPGMPAKILKWIGREDAPFLLRPQALPGLLGWGLKFLRACNEESWRRNTGIILKIADHSLGALDRLTREAGLDYDLTQGGTLRLFRDPLSMENARRSADLVGSLGVDFKVLDAPGCAAVEPALIPQLAQISGGIHFPDDASGDAYKFTAGLAERCQALGVVFRFGVTIRDIETAGGAVTAVVTDAGRLTADKVLVALGSASTPLLRRLGLRLPVYPVKGYSATLPIAGWNGAPRVPLVDDGRKMAVARLGDRLRLAGTAEFNGYNLDLNPRRGAKLVESMLELFPGCPEPESAEHWTGLRPMTPDGIPILGATPVDNLFVNAGHGHLGWTLSCGTAEVVADVMAGERPAIDLAGMTLARF